MPTVTEVLAAALDHHHAGRLDRAEQIYRQVLQFDSNQADALHLLGLLTHQRGRGPEALALLERAVAANGTNAAYHVTVGAVHEAAGRLEDAAAAFGRAVSLGKDSAEPHFRLGAALAALGRHERAAEELAAALRLEPDLVEARAQLGVTLRRLGRHQAARDVLESAASSLDMSRGVDRNLAPVIYFNLAKSLEQVGSHGDVVSCFRRALALDPANADAHNDLGLQLLLMGDSDAALAHYRAAIALRPEDPFMHSNLLYAFNFVPTADPEAVFAEHQRWESRHARPHYARIRPHGNVRDPERRLRVGYLSADLNNHPITYNVEGLIRHHDRDRFEVYCFSDLASVASDATTHRLGRISDHWRVIAGVPDEAAADMIRADKIDILVSLAGHTAFNRLTILAHKPAPVQIGYGVGTSGMTAVDYWLSDPILHPPETRERCAEELWRLPHLVIHQPPQEAPDVAPLPARRNGWITFGCFNNPAKLAPELVALWARILHAVPTARLRLKYMNWLDQADLVARVRERFAAHGIDGARLLIGGGLMARPEHLALVGSCDVILDSAPFNGWTTTFEALYMGVPVVTLTGDRFLGRVGASFLSAAGLPELIADNADAYVGIAVGLAKDVARLDALRRDLRARVLASPLCDASVYARTVEAAYREMWRRWCAKT
ncbi:MAG: tetratricopeptide repeat protein [Alphaproteobacteria bacterium]|nr:tetratricopeptide repeat protein [Alphaproteobacteria bacterium]